MCLVILLLSDQPRTGGSIPRLAQLICPTTAFGGLHLHGLQGSRRISWYCGRVCSTILLVYYKAYRGRALYRILCYRILSYLSLYGNMCTTQVTAS